MKDSSLTIWFSERELDEAPWYLWLLHRIVRDPLLGIQAPWGVPMTRIFFYPLAGLFVWGAQPLSQLATLGEVLPEQAAAALALPDLGALLGFSVVYVGCHRPRGLVLPRNADANGIPTGCVAGRIARQGANLGPHPAGVACFHLQHHCNSPYRAWGAVTNVFQSRGVPDDASRTHLDAALVGSTRIPLAWPLSVFSFGIEYHHIHHFDIRVPGYRLERCDAEGEAADLWTQVNTVDATRAIKSLCHTQFEGASGSAA